MSENVAALTCYMPTELRERARRVAKKLRTSTVQILRDGLVERLDMLEAKMREQKDRDRADKEETRTMRTMRKLGEKLPPLASPPPPAPPSGSSEALGAPAEVDRFAAIYEQHGRKIFEALDSPLEKHARTMEAVAAVKRAAPLTCPSDYRILEALERVVLRLREEAPAKKPTLSLLQPKKPQLDRTFDELVGRIIDPTRVRTRGSAPPDDNEPE